MGGRRYDHEGSDRDPVIESQGGAMIIAPVWAREPGRRYDHSASVREPGRRYDHIASVREPGRRYDHSARVREPRRRYDHSECLVVWAKGIAKIRCFQTVFSQKDRLRPLTTNAPQQELAWL